MCKAFDFDEEMRESMQKFRHMLIAGESPWPWEEHPDILVSNKTIGAERLLLPCSVIFSGDKDIERNITVKLSNGNTTIITLGKGVSAEIIINQKENESA